MEEEIRYILISSSGCSCMTPVFSTDNIKEIARAAIDYYSLSFGEVNLAVERNGIPLSYEEFKRHKTLVEKRIEELINRVIIPK